MYTPHIPTTMILHGRRKPEKMIAQFVQYNTLSSESANDTWHNTGMYSKIAKEKSRKCVENTCPVRNVS